MLTQPNLTVAVDTRTYLYDYDYLVAYGRARGLRPGWQAFVAAIGAGAAVLPTEDPMTLALVQQLDRTERQRTDGYTLLVAP